MVGILMDGYFHAPSGVQDVKLVVDEDMPIMAPIGAAPALRLSMKDAKFKWYLAGVDSQEHVRKVAGGFVCHDECCLLQQRYGLHLPKYGSKQRKVLLNGTTYLNTTYFEEMRKLL